MDRLSMSLDDIMAAKNKEFKEKLIGSKKVVAGNNKTATKVGNIKVNLNKASVNQRSTPYLETNPSRSVVVPVVKKVPINNNNNHSSNSYVASERSVKIIQPTQEFVVNKVVPIVKKPIEQKVAPSVFARLGKQPVSGTRVTFDNLQKSVTEADLRELSAAIGEVKDIEFSSAVSGSVGVKSKKAAVVLFARRSDALNCIEKYNGLTLDGALLEVSLTEVSVGAQVAVPKNVFERLQSKKVVHNVKAGLFGTAINDDDDEEVGEYAEVEVNGYEDYDNNGGFADDDSDGRVQFAVTMNTNQQRQQPSARVVQPPYRQVVYQPSYDQDPREVRPSQPIRYNGQRPVAATYNNFQSRSNHSNNSKKGANLNGNRGGGSSDLKRGGKVVSSADLDNELDSYFAAK